MSVGRVTHVTKPKFYSMQDDGGSRLGGLGGRKAEESEPLIQTISENIIGKNSTFIGPFGKRKVIYCDYYGSGRSLQFIEDHIQKEILPFYGVDSPSVSHTSVQSKFYKEESRSIVREACHCSQTDRVVLGGTLAHLARILRTIRAVIFVGVSDDVKNIKPWEEVGAKIVYIAETREGFLDLNDLETKLQSHSTTGQKLIGCFSTASKVTGALVDTVAATLVLHQYGALSVWCHSLAVGWCGIDMNPDLPGLEDSRMVQKDAVFFSCKQIPGGLQAPNILIINRAILNRGSFCDNIHENEDLMEECDSLDAVRVGLVMQLRDIVGQQNIMLRQENITRQVLSHIRNIPELIILGGNNAKRVPMFPLLVRHPRGAFLHHNFVCAVLSDVFGVQATSAGCNGDMLSIDEDLAKEYSKVLGDDGNIHSYLGGNEHLRPGFFRISFPYFISDSELAFVLESLKMVATEAWKILPQYVVDPDTGTWAHRTHTGSSAKQSLSSISYKDATIVEEKINLESGIFPQTFFECLQTARNLFNGARKSAQRYPLREHDIKFNAKKDYLRWFMLPMEAQELLLGNSGNVKHIVPFDPAMLHSGRRSGLNSGNSSPVPTSSPRHYSLSAIDAQDIFIFSSKYKALSRESSIVEPSLVPPNAVKMENSKPAPLQFAVGEEVTTSVLYNAPINKLIKGESRLTRARCHSLGSDSPPAANTQTRLSLGANNSYLRTLETCNCSSQTDLHSLDDVSTSPNYYMYTHKEHESNSDCSQLGRTSPTASITSHTSEDIQAYVKEMTKEIAIELKSEIREVISRVEDVLENTDPVNIENRNFCLANNASSHNIASRNSVSVSDVAEYLMGVSKEMASEVKHEIREMVNQVDEIISPEVSASGVNFYLSSPSTSRKNSPPEMTKRTPGGKNFYRIKSTPQTTLCNKGENKIILRKSPTSPVIMVSENTKHFESDLGDKADHFRSKKNIGQSGDSSESPQHSPDNIPHDVPCPGSMSFNSSDTSSPDTIIQVLSSTVSMSVPIVSSHKLSDDENSCNESDCQQLYCKSRIWYHNNSVSSQDSGINMSFIDQDHGGHPDAVKKRPNSDSSCYRRKKNHSRMRNSSGVQRQEKNEVPDIIEGVPTCSDDYRNYYRNETVQKKHSTGNRVEFRDCDSTDNRSNFCMKDYPTFQRTNRGSPTNSESTDVSRKSSANTDSYNSKKSSTTTVSSEDCARCSDLSCCQHLDSITGGNTNTSEMCRSRLSSNSSSDSDYPADCPYEEDGKWHCPPKSIWKGTVEAMQEFGMIRHQDRILVCLSGGAHSLSLLHTLHQYQFYARAKGIHFTIGAVTICDGSSDIDPIHLMAYCKTLGVKYIYQDNVDIAPCANSYKHRDQDLCSFTSHWIRRQIYRCASEHGYNVIATGQHLDDVARCFIISVFTNGRLRTMKAHYFIKELNLRVIRPLIYVREKNLNQFVESRHLPQFRTSKANEQDLVEDCIFKGENKAIGGQHENRSTIDKDISPPPMLSKMNRSMSAPCSSRRTGAVAVMSGRVRAKSAPCGPHALKGLLESQEANQPGLFASLKSALHPLISARNIEKDMKEYRHRKRSVIQMKNGAPVYNSDDGTDEEPVP